MQVYGDEVRAVLMESDIVWANCSDPSLAAAAAGATSNQWPALVSTDAQLSSQMMSFLSFSNKMLSRMDIKFISMYFSNYSTYKVVVVSVKV